MCESMFVLIDGTPEELIEQGFMKIKNSEPIPCSADKREKVMPEKKLTSDQQDKWL